MHPALAGGEESFAQGTCSLGHLCSNVLPCSLHHCHDGALQASLGRASLQSDKEGKVSEPCRQTVCSPTPRAPRLPPSHALPSFPARPEDAGHGCLLQMGFPTLPCVGLGRTSSQPHQLLAWMQAGSTGWNPNRSEGMRAHDPEANGSDRQRTCPERGITSSEERDCSLNLFQVSTERLVWASTAAPTRDSHQLGFHEHYPGTWVLPWLGGHWGPTWRRPLCSCLRGCDPGTPRPGSGTCILSSAQSYFPTPPHLWALCMPINQLAPVIKQGLGAADIVHLQLYLLPSPWDIESHSCYMPLPQMQCPLCLPLSMSSPPLTACVSVRVHLHPYPQPVNNLVCLFALEDARLLAGYMWAFFSW